MRKRDLAASKRRIGGIFVERGHITEEQLAVALAEQQATGQMLGEILVASCGVSRLELASVLEELWAERDAGLIKGPSVIDIAALAAAFERRTAELDSRLSAVETLLAAMSGATRRTPRSIRPKAEPKKSRPAKRQE